MNKQVTPPIAASNLTNLDDIAAAVYTVTATEPVLWEDLPNAEKGRWRVAVAYLLDLIVELPRGWHDQSPELDQLREDAVSARHIAETEMRKAIQHAADMDRIRREVGG